MNNAENQAKNLKIYIEKIANKILANKVVSGVTTGVVKAVDNSEHIYTIGLSGSNEEVVATSIDKSQTYAIDNSVYLVYYTNDTDPVYLIYDTVKNAYQTYFNLTPDERFLNSDNGEFILVSDSQRTLDYIFGRNTEDIDETVYIQKIKNSGCFKIEANFSSTSNFNYGLKLAYYRNDPDLEENKGIEPFKTEYFDTQYFLGQPGNLSSKVVQSRVITLLEEEREKLNFIKITNFGDASFSNLKIICGMLLNIESVFTTTLIVENNKNYFSPDEYEDSVTLIAEVTQDNNKIISNSLSYYWLLKDDNFIDTTDSQYLDLSGAGKGWRCINKSDLRYIPELNSNNELIEVRIWQKSKSKITISEKEIQDNELLFPNFYNTVKCLVTYKDVVVSSREVDIYNYYKETFSARLDASVNPAMILNKDDSFTLSCTIVNENNKINNNYSYTYSWYKKTNTLESEESGFMPAADLNITPKDKEGKYISNIQSLTVIDKDEEVALGEAIYEMEDAHEIIYCIVEITDEDSNYISTETTNILEISSALKDEEISIASRKEFQYYISINNMNVSFAQSTSNDENIWNGEWDIFDNDIENPEWKELILEDSQGNIISEYEAYKKITGDSYEIFKQDIEDPNSNNVYYIYYTEKTIWEQSTDEQNITTIREENWHHPILARAVVFKGSDTWENLKTNQAIEQINIFNQLTNYGKEQGIFYSDENYIVTKDTVKNGDKVYYIKEIYPNGEVKYNEFKEEAFKEGISYYEKTPTDQKLYINANYINTGALRVGNGSTEKFYASVESENVKIGGFNVDTNSLSAGSDNEIVYLGTDGIKVGNVFSVSDKGVVISNHDMEEIISEVIEFSERKMNAVYSSSEKKPNIKPYYRINKETEQIETNIGEDSDSGELWYEEYNENKSIWMCQKYDISLLDSDIPWEDIIQIVALQPYTISVDNDFIAVPAKADGELIDSNWETNAIIQVFRGINQIEFSKDNLEVTSKNIDATIVKISRNFKADLQESGVHIKRRIFIDQNAENEKLYDESDHYDNIKWGKDEDGRLFWQDIYIESDGTESSQTWYYIRTTEEGYDEWERYEADSSQTVIAQTTPLTEFQAELLISNFVNDEDNAKVTVEYKQDNISKASAAIEIIKQKEGADGDPATFEYALVNTNVIKRISTEEVNKFTFEPSILNITMYKKEGSNAPIKASDLTYYLTCDDLPSSAVSTSKGYEFNITIPNGYNKNSIQADIYIKDNNNSKIIIDKVTVNIVEDGAQGERGVSVGGLKEYYAWHNSETTPPDLDSNKWAENEVPENTNNDKFLWNYEISYDTDEQVIPGTQTTPIVVYRRSDDGDPGDSFAGVKNLYAYAPSGEWNNTWEENHNNSAGSGDYSTNPSTKNIIINWTEKVLTTTSDKPFVWNKEQIGIKKANTDEITYLNEYTTKQVQEHPKVLCIIYHLGENDGTAPSVPANGQIREGWTLIPHNNSKWMSQKTDYSATSSYVAWGTPIRFGKDGDIGPSGRNPLSTKTYYCLSASNTGNGPGIGSLSNINSYNWEFDANGKITDCTLIDPTLNKWDRFQWGSEEYIFSNWSGRQADVGNISSGNLSNPGAVTYIWKRSVTAYDNKTIEVQTVSVLVPELEAVEKAAAYQIKDNIWVNYFADPNNQLYPNLSIGTRYQLKDSITGNLETAFINDQIDDDPNLFFPGATETKGIGEGDIGRWCRLYNRTVISGGAIVTGSITADKIKVNDLISLQATIGGWEIKEGSLCSGSSDTYVSLNSSSDNGYAFWAGAEDPSEANYSVSKNGYLTVKYEDGFVGISPLQKGIIATEDSYAQMTLNAKNLIFSWNESNKLIGTIELSPELIEGSSIEHFATEKALAIKTVKTVSGRPRDGRGVLIGNWEIGTAGALSWPKYNSEDYMAGQYYSHPIPGIWHIEIDTGTEGLGDNIGIIIGRDKIVVQAGESFATLPGKGHGFLYLYGGCANLLAKDKKGGTEWWEFGSGFVGSRIGNDDDYNENVGQGPYYYVSIDYLINDTKPRGLDILLFGI